MAEDDYFRSDVDREQALVLRTDTSAWRSGNVAPISGRGCGKERLCNPPATARGHVLIVPGPRNKEPAAQVWTMRLDPIERVAPSRGGPYGVPED